MGLVINLKADTGLVDRSENTTRFLKDVKDFPTLTREEEIEWFTKYKHGTKEEKEIARDYIMLCNQRMIIAAAKKWAKTDTLMDYVNEANFGLNEAIEKFDPSKKTLYAGDTPISLTKHEYNLIGLLIKYPEKIYSKQELFELAWDEYYIGEDKTINVHISNIRKKLFEATGKEYIDTVWGIGVRLKKQ